jgi:hypothetical protein
MYVHMPHGNKFFHVRQYFNDVAKNIHIIFYLCDKEYSINFIFFKVHLFMLTCSFVHIHIQANVVGSKCNTHCTRVKNLHLDLDHMCNIHIGHTFYYHVASFTLQHLFAILFNFNFNLYMAYWG